MGKVSFAFFLSSCLSQTHITVCAHVLNYLDIRTWLITLHSLPMIFFATNGTFADAKATAVSAIISTIGDPSPNFTDLCMKLSSTMSISSGTCPMEPQIFAWIDGYISTSSMVKVISFSIMPATCFCLFFSSVGLQNLGRKQRDEEQLQRRLSSLMNVGRCKKGCWLNSNPSDLQSLYPLPYGNASQP